MRMVSFIVPAHNEETWIEACIKAIQEGASSNAITFELLVVDDASSDRTARLAEQRGARVLRVSHRQIAAARNAGGRAAVGDALFFVDADTRITATVIRSAVELLDQGAIGGGCVPLFDGQLPLWWRVSYPIFVIGVRALGQPGGSCLFCTRTAFEAVGGFSQEHFAAEDAVFVRALKSQGRFVVLKPAVLTSGRNLRAHSFWTIARLLGRLAIHGPAGFRDRRGLEFWYSPARTRPGDRGGEA